MESSVSFNWIDRNCMERAIAAAETVRCITSPNPWVGAVIRSTNGQIFIGSTGEPGEAHAEVAAINQAGGDAKGATLYSTLEPCPNTGRTGPCTQAIIDAGISKVVIGIKDPDEQVNGLGIQALRDEGIQVDVGLYADRISKQLAPYIKHCKTGKPFVVLKLAMTLDGKIAAPDSSSRWITGDMARADAHKLRAQSDVVIVGARTFEHDHPQLDVRDYVAPIMPKSGSLDPQKVVLGKTAVADNSVRVMSGDIHEILDKLGAENVLQVLIEGGAATAGEFHRAGVIDQYIFYIAPALFGGNDATPLFAGEGAGSISQIWRGSLASVTKLGEDIRVEVSAENIVADTFNENGIEHVAQANLPTEWGDFTCHVYESSDGEQHVVLVAGDVTDEEEEVLVRVHSECLTGDIFRSKKCDCGAQLDSAMEAIATQGKGVLVYMRGHEGRGIGIGSKISAYALQDAGLDTVEANLALGLPIDSRDYSISAKILTDLGIKSVRLITNNPNKFSDLEKYGPKVIGRVELSSKLNSHNEEYLKTKRDRLGHKIDWLSD